MAVVAIPPLVGAVEALLVALGVITVAGGAVVVTEEVKKRQKAASEAGTSDAAKTATQTKTKTCEKCPPDCGLLVSRNWNMSAAAREYQARVTAFAPGTEWNFGGIDFDGFASAECMLKEAKSRYDQFLTGGEDSELAPKKWFRAFELKMLPQAEAQAAVTRAAPPARLTWYFQGPKTYAYMGPQVMLVVPIVAVYIP
jgi:Restriction endonuclease fold toxin 5